MTDTSALRPPADALLTESEHRAMELTVKLFNLIVLEIMGSGTSFAGDQRELALHIHGIQNMILSQAAARAYPDRYRLLGEVLDG